MSFKPPQISLRWRILLSVLIALMVGAIIWVSSQFKSPPGIDLLTFLWLFIAFITFEIVAKTQNKIVRLAPLKNSKFNSAASVSISIMTGMVGYSCLFYLFKWVDFFVNRNEVPTVSHMTMAALIGLIISTVFGFIQLGVNWKHQYFAAQLENEQFKNEIAQANLSILKNQLDPHFMFNNFNTLYYLIDEDSELAQKFLKNVSTIYRYILQNNDKTLISIREELAMANQYLAVIQQRYAGLLQSDIQFQPEALENKAVPPLVLQQLIENAIKHNRIDEESPLHISFSLNEGYLVVKNGINLKKVESTSKTGLINIAKRYEYLTDRQMIIDESSNEFSVSIPLIERND